MDPRGWDLNQMLAAFEAALRRSAKDENEWRRISLELSAEPRESRVARRQAAAKVVQEGRERPQGGSMTVDAAEAMLARFAASDAQYG